MLDEKNKKYNWLDLTTIIMGAVIAIPALMTGFIMARKYGFISTAISIFVGNIIIALIALPIALDARKGRKTSTQKIEEILGIYGAKISACALMIVLIGWFAIQLSLISSTFSMLMPKNLVSILIGLVLCIFVTGGISRIKAISKYSLPLFAISVSSTMIYTSYYGRGGDVLVYDALLNKEILLVVIASSFTLLFDLPTYYRFSASKKDTIVSIILSFIAISLVESLGASFTLISSSTDVTGLFTSVDSNILLGINMLFILAAGCSVNSNNLYVSAINFAIVAPKISLRMRVIFIGIAGLLLSFFDILAHFSLLLNGMMILIASITSLLFIDALQIIKKKNYVAGILAITTGTTVGVLSLSGLVKLFDFAFIEAAIVTGIIYIIILKVKNDKKN